MVSWKIKIYTQFTYINIRVYMHIFKKKSNKELTPPCQMVPNGFFIFITTNQFKFVPIIQSGASNFDVQKFKEFLQQGISSCGPIGWLCIMYYMKHTYIHINTYKTTDRQLDKEFLKEFLVLNVSSLRTGSLFSLPLYPSWPNI